MPDRLPVIDRRSRRRFVSGLGVGAVALGVGLPLRAQNERPISLVVGYLPGGSTDLTARLVGAELATRLGQTVIVENVGGAGGALGAQKVAAARPDGCDTVALGTNNEMAIQKLVSPAARTDGLVDFTPLGLIGTQPMLLVAGPATNIRTLDQFLSHVRSAPGKTSFGSSGVGTALHLAGEMIKQQAGLFIVHIPYRGVAPLTTDLIGGQIEFAIFVLSSGLPHVRAGKVHALGVTQLKPSAIAPEIAPLGLHPQLRGLDIGSWFGLWGPARLPASVTQRLQAALRDALQSPELRRKLEEAGATVADSAVDLTTYHRGELAKYQRIVKFANIKE